MAVHEDSSVHKNKSSDGLDEISAFNVENMLNNTRIINYSRTLMSIIGGVIAGILGFTSLTGFIFYFIVMAITTAGLAAKTGFAVHSYFDSWNRIVFDGILGGLLSFVLFWTHNQILFDVSNKRKRGLQPLICLRHRPYFLKNVREKRQSAMGRTPLLEASMQKSQF